MEQFEAIMPYISVNEIDDVGLSEEQMRAMMHHIQTAIDTSFIGQISTSGKTLPSSDTFRFQANPKPEPEPEPERDPKWGMF